MSADTGTATTTLPAGRAHLGAFLRTVRGRVPPSAGTPTARRRTRGLRREEVALRAGISVTWYTWLEQGRPVHPSLKTLRGIASALQMSEAERDHLLSLAPAAGEGEPSITTMADGAILLLVESLVPHPAYAVNGRWDVLAANRPATTVFGRFDARPGTTDNILRRLFLDPRWREGFAEWPSLAASVVGQFRGATAALASDPEWQRFVETLQGQSPDFHAVWSRHEVSAPAAHEKRFHHPRLGALRFHYSSVAPDDAPDDVRVIIYRPADPRTLRALRR